MKPRDEQERRERRVQFVWSVCALAYIAYGVKEAEKKAREDARAMREINARYDDKVKRLEKLLLDNGIYPTLKESDED